MGLLCMTDKLWAYHRLFLREVVSQLGICLEGEYSRGLYVVSKKFLWIFYFLVIFPEICSLLVGYLMMFQDFSVFVPL